jgi:hypothetical protein
MAGDPRVGEETEARNCDGIVARVGDKEEGEFRRSRRLDGVAP